MAGFIRRYGFYPGAELIRQIEGVIIIDLPPPGAVAGVGVGTVGMVGEFADMTYATTVDGSGVVTTKVVPTEVFGSRDLIDKFGGFDPSIGDFGVSLGSGFIALRNKRFSRLVGIPVNLASAQGSRYFRQLPVCVSQTNANPVVPVSAAQIDAGREFRSGVGRLHIAKRVNFTGRAPIATGVTGNTAAGAAAATQVFNANVGFDWTLVDRGDGTLGAKKGDILVIGNNNGGALQPVAEAGTYRVQADPAAGVAITIERLDGQNFTFTAQANVPWRLHFSTDADSAPERVVGAVVPGGYSASENGGYSVPVRPITNAAGGAVDGTYPIGTVLTPAVVPPALTGSSADGLSGLGARLHPGTATAFTAALQRSNAPASASLDAAYATAIDSLESEELPAREVNIVTAARKSTANRSKLRSFALATSAVGRGVTVVLSPALTTLNPVTVLGDADPGVGANRNQRVDYCWPGVIHSVPEAVGFLLSTADGLTTQDGVLDDTTDHWLVSVLSNLAPERNPGQAGPPVDLVLAPILGIQRGVSNLGMNEYIAFRARGICAIRIDRTVGPIFQSGITTSLIAGEKNIARRRMADFIQDSISERLVQLAKQPLTESLKDTATGETVAFLEQLLSPGNPAAQRISSYVVDDKSGNTPDLEAQGIFVLIIRVRTLASADFIVLQTEIGEGVVTVTQQAA